MAMDEKKLIFKKDELAIKKVADTWSEEIVFFEEGLFYLKDLQRFLKGDYLDVIRKANEIQKSGRSSWKEIGVRKLWKNWGVRMKVFGPYYRKHFFSPVRSIPKAWDANRLLQEKGLFSLVKVCRLLPLNAAQIRYQAKKNPNSKVEIGVWKDEKEKIYIVNMEVFSIWLIKFWREP